jgi:hypothetical protein
MKNTKTEGSQFHTPIVTGYRKTLVAAAGATTECELSQAMLRCEYQELPPEQRWADP